MILQILTVVFFSCLATQAQGLGETDGTWVGHAKVEEESKPANGIKPEDDASDKELTTKLQNVFKPLRARYPVPPPLPKPPHQSQASPQRLELVLDPLLISPARRCADRLNSAGLAHGDTEDSLENIRRCQSDAGKNEVTYWHTSEFTNQNVIVGEIDESWTKAQFRSYFNKYQSDPAPKLRTYEEEEKQFTQVLWAETNKFGCSTVELDSGGSVTACTFSPAGNVVHGRLERNAAFLINIPDMWGWYAMNSTESGE